MLLFFIIINLMTQYCRTWSAKKKNINVTVNVGSSVIGNTDDEKLLGVVIDN